MIAGAVGAAILGLAQTPYVSAETPYVVMASPPPGNSTCPGGLCGAAALEPFFEDLRATEDGVRDRPVHILQIGDSHTAGDRITGAVRARLQARFGAAGRGVLPPGIPYPGYTPMQVEVTTTDWPIRTDILAAGRLPTSVGLTASEADVGGRAVMRIAAESSGVFDQVQVCGEGWLEDGELILAGSTATRTMRFAGPRGEVWRPGCQTAMFDTPQTQLELRPIGRLKLYDVRLTRWAAGVEVSNLGAVGGTVQDLALRDGNLVRIELEAWRPALIVLAFGVNEGFAPTLDPAEYEAWLRSALVRIQTDAPLASVLVLGAPEGLKTGEGGPCGGRSAPPSLTVVRDVQERVAAELGVAFWDWRGRMGGACSAERLATLAEPYMRPDRVHFTSVGGDWIGGVLADDLTNAYDRWKAGAR